MRRKLIKQGGSGLTLYIPKKWLDQHRLRAGDELEIEEKEGKLVLATQHQQKEPSQINITIPLIRESVTRTLIVNAYRAGYDKLFVTYDGKQEDLNTVVEQHLIGFEVFRKKEKLYSIESVAEPNYDNFENIIEKQFFMVLEILRTLETADCSELTHKIQRYDNFLKRCISKNVVSVKAMPFLWQFLSNVAHIARQGYHFNKLLRNTKRKFTPKEKQFFQEIIGMFGVLQKSYLGKKIEPLFALHELDKKILQEKGMKLLQSEKPTHMHYLLTIGRLIYLANTPLEGYLQEFAH
ncbi:AbrB/MazE/SpoVT family DNA-binding domain-containing protein [Candidatus Woesearchaeota archaeon]|nr:AbrB/MazE/SpoVT family DNA-binding domain-containing protein [Candidatus Woesearchaeota archaeon]